MDATGGQTKGDPSSWTIDSLNTHIQRIINDRDVMWMELRKADEQRYEQRFSAQQLAIAKAENSIERRLENTNEWRAAMNDRDLKLLPRQEFDSIMREWQEWRKATVATREGLASRLIVIETRAITWTAALGIFFVVIQIAMYWLLHK